MLYIYLLISFIIVIFLYNSLHLVEGMDTITNNVDSNKIIYQNQGAIQNLQNQIKQIMESITKINNSDAQQNASIKSISDNMSSNFREINSKITANTKLANQSYDLSKQNKESILKMVNQTKAKVNNVKQQMTGIPPLK
jgi:predicted PurR-regulated permease PerM